MTTPAIDMALNEAVGNPAMMAAASQLCASCERCRARKTKCDGERPCGNCVGRYKKINKCEDIDGVDLACFDCVYSVAKRRGPVPGRSTNRHMDNYEVYGLLPDNLPYPIMSGGTGMMGGLGFMGQQNGMVQHLNNGNLPVGLNAFSGAIPAGGFAEGRLGNYDMSNMNNTMDSFIAAVEGMVGGANNITTSNFSVENLNLLLTIQQQQGLLLEQQQQQLHSNAANGIGSESGMMGGTSYGGMMKNTGLNVPRVNSTAAAMFEGSDANWSSSAGLSLQSFPDVVTANQQQQLQEQQQPQIMINQLSTMYHINHDNHNDRSAKRSHHAQPSNINGAVSVEASFDMTSTNADVLPISVARYIPLLQPSSTHGALLRSYYELSTNDVLSLPPIPTDEEYFARLSLLSNSNHYKPNKLPTFDQNALRAARFAELSLGALANNQVSLAMELSNASVICLRDCVDKPAHTSCIYDVSRAYLLLGIFRSFRGDMLRYFKYRRVCMMHIMKLDSVSTHKTQPPVEALLAAISFHDAWCYVIHNGSIESLPNIDESLPRLSNTSTNVSNSESATTTNTCSSINASTIASDPLNQMWMQGSAPLFLNNEANLVSRSIDAFSCAIRTCCDHANTTFEEIAQASGIAINTTGPLSPTMTAILANENELCSRNIVMSAKTLLEQHSNISAFTAKKHGLIFVAHAMSAFVENSQSDDLQEGGGDDENKLNSFTPAQIKNLLAASEIIIQHPLLLYSPGPVYHMAGNVAIMLCHLLNAIYSKYNSEAAKNKKNSGGGIHPPVNMADSILFDEALETYITMRRILNIHRKNLPVKLRCHGLPRPSGLGLIKKPSENETKIYISDPPPQESFIVIGETLLCLCRGCQGFVLMGCSPCVAAERLVKAAKDAQNDECKQIGDGFLNFQEISDADFDRCEHRWGEEGFNLSGDLHSNDHDGLLDILSRIMKNS